VKEDIVNLRGRNLLTSTDLSAEEFLYLVELGRKLRAERRFAFGFDERRLAGRNIALIFEKTSTRTRAAFEVAAHEEGAHVSYLGPGEFMPAFVLPQTLLCGLVVPRDQMTAVLRWLSDVLPLSYAVDAMQRITTATSWTSAISADVAVILAFTAAALVGGALTLRRRTR
jgi:Aspartate/ornithine carbamoyltransferase, carbamoyl-P binding domain/ABC-2 type transporter